MDPQHSIQAIFYYEPAIQTGQAEPVEPVELVGLVKLVGPVGLAGPQ